MGEGNDTTTGTAPRTADDEKARDAVGALSEALEVTEEARGALYRFHRMTGRADMKLDEAIAALREAGATELADAVERQLRGRDVLPGRWTFQIVEEYDDGYYALFRRLEERARDQLTGGRRHVAEAALKDARQTPEGRWGAARP